MFRRRFGLLGLLLVIVLHAQDPKGSARPVIRITSPNAEAQVGVRANVTGNISGNRGDGRLYVLVRALSWSNWYVQPLPVMHEDGVWEANCYFGEPNAGKTERYAVIAILRPKGRELLKEGQQLADVPEGVAASGIVTVVRK
jgi:hypothetical protein